MLFGQKILNKVVSCVAVMSLFAFAGIGSVYAAGGQTVTFEAGDESSGQLCESTGGTLNGNICQCPDGKPVWNSEQGCVEGSLETLKVSCTESGGSWGDDNNECKCPANMTLVNGACVANRSEAQDACETNDDPNGIGEWDSEENICKCRGVFILNPETGKCYKPSSAQMAEACQSSGGTWEDSTCTCPGNASLVSGFCRCNSGYTMTGGQCVLNQTSSGGGSIDLKIATNAFNAARFTPVESSLATTVGTIKTVVANAIANTTRVNTIQTTKQVRPDEDRVDSEANLEKCPADKQCLLVTAPNQTPKWYEIIDCVGNSFFTNVGTDAAFAGITNATDGGQNCGGYKDGNTAHRACAESIAGCGTDQWMRSFTNGAVYGEAIRLTVAESAGAIVTLPVGTQNDTSGTKCLCRATGYRLRTGDEYGALVSLSSNDKWWVRGAANNVNSCSHDCAFDGDTQSGNGIDMPYYTELGRSNVCAGATPQAHMCMTSDFLASIANGTVTHTHSSVAGTEIDASNAGWVKEDGTKMGLCSSLNDCGVAGSHAWVEKYGTGYVYGRAKLANIMEYDYRISPYAPGLIKLTGNEEERGVCLCQVTGYKTSSNATKQTYANDLWMIVSGHEQGDYGTSYDSTDGYACTRSCAKYFGDIANTAGYYAAIDDLCTDDLSGYPTATPATCDATYMTTCTNSGGYWTSRNCSCSCNTYNHEVLDSTTHACVCASGYVSQNGQCVLDCSSKPNSHADNGVCVCDANYTDDNDTCVLTAQLRCQDTTGSRVGGTWSGSCTCKSHATLDANGYCVCATGYHEGSNNTCEEDTQCDVVEGLIQPGTKLESGEAWVVEGGTGPNGLWGGKACDGRIAGILNASNSSNYNADYSCHADEWVHAYQNVAIYGEAKMVSITDTNVASGNIVALPNNVAEVNAGGVCVCRVKAYADASGGTGFSTTYSSRDSIDVGNTWMIAGRRENYGENETGKQACITDCAFYTNDAKLITYYETVGDSCSETQPLSTTACTPNTQNADPYVNYVNMALAKGSVIRADAIGISALVDKEGKGTGLCANDNTSICAKPANSLNNWVLQYTIADSAKYKTATSDNASNIYNGTWVMYGNSRCVAMNSKLQEALPAVNRSARVQLEVEQAVNNTETGVVCIRNIAGYSRFQEGKWGDMTAVNSGGWWYATRYEKSSDCQAACNNTNESLRADDLLSDVNSLSAPINGSCSTN